MHHAHAQVGHKWVPDSYCNLPFVADGWGPSGIYFMPRAANNQLVFGSVCTCACPDAHAHAQMHMRMPRCTCARPDAHAHAQMHMRMPRAANNHGRVAHGGSHICMGTLPCVHAPVPVPVSAPAEGCALCIVRVCYVYVGYAYVCYAGGAPLRERDCRP